MHHPLSVVIFCPNKGWTSTSLKHTPFISTSIAIVRGIEGRREERNEEIVCICMCVRTDENK